MSGAGDLGYLLGRVGRVLKTPGGIVALLIAAFVVGRFCSRDSTPAQASAVARETLVPSAPLGVPMVQPPPPVEGPTAEPAQLPNVHELVEKAKDAVRGKTEAEVEAEKQAVNDSKTAQTNRTFGCWKLCMDCDLKCGDDTKCSASCYAESGKCCWAAGAVPNGKCGCEK